MSAARIMGLLYGCMGLLFAPFFLLFGLLGSLVGSDKTPFAGIFGVVFAILMPVIYGVMGFVMGAIGALLYNLLAKWVGGFELELLPPCCPSRGALSLDSSAIAEHLDFGEGDHVN